MTSFDIPAENIWELQFRIDALNGRAAKLGVTPVAIVIGDATVIPADKTTDPATPESVTYAVEITGDIITLAGWHFVGTVEHAKTGNILRAVPGQELDESYRDIDATCDHCGTKRNRVETFVVEHEDGTVKRIGRSCTRDYLGSANAQQIAAWLTSVHELDDAPHGGSAHTRRHFAAVEIVTLAAVDVRLRGAYYPARMTTSTASQVQNFLNLRGKARTEWLAETRFSVTAADIAEGEALVAWAAEQTDATGYVANLRAAAALESVTSKHIGLLVSLPVAKRTDEQRAAEQVERDAEKAAREAEAATADDAPRGRIEVTGTVLKITERETEYGVTTKLIVQHETGWKLWVTRPEALRGEWDAQGEQTQRGVVEGDVVTMTVKVEPSPSDPKFAFGSRPSKASIEEAL